MFWKVLRYANQHDSAVWKFLRLSYRWLWMWIVLTNLFKMLTPRPWSIVSLPEYANFWIRKFFRKDSPFSQHVPSYPNRQLHPPLFGVPPLWQLPLLHDRVTTKRYGHCPPHCAEKVFCRVRFCVPLVPQGWEQELQTLQLPTRQFTGLHGALRLRLRLHEKVELISMHKSRKQIVKMLIFISRFSQLFA